MTYRIGFLALLAGTFGIGAAHAQHVWVDEKGVKQYSDMAPPASVPKNRILKSPGAATPREAPAAEIKHGAAPSESAAKAPMTTAERNADFLKRKAEREEKEKKAAEQAKTAADKSRNCDRAREYRRVLDSGQRIAVADGESERSIMSDEQRVKEARETQRVLDDCKK